MILTILNASLAVGAVLTHGIMGCQSMTGHRKGKCISSSPSALSLTLTGELEWQGLKGENSFSFICSVVTVSLVRVHGLGRLKQDGAKNGYSLFLGLL